jgi:pilus assembly protein CpaE
MSATLQALVALDDEVDRGFIETLISGGSQVTVLDYLDLGGSTASGYGVGDVLIVACADYRQEVGEYVAQASRQHPARPVVLLCPAAGNGFLPDAFATGVDDIVTLPANPGATVDPDLAKQLVFALEKAVIRKRGAPTEDHRAVGRMICVLGLKGGCGKTLTAANVGVALALAGRKVALIDLDLQFGDLALAMGLRPDRTLYDLVRSGGSLDAEKLEDYMVTHQSGARVLLAPVSPDQAGLVTVPFLREVERLLCATHDFVLVDTPPNFTPEVIAATDVSTDVLMVAMRDTLSLKNTKLGLETLERMGYDRSRIRLVLNRANTNVGIERQDVLAIIGRDADVLVPSHRNVTRSVNQGDPIVQHPGSGAAKAFRAIADLYIGDPDPKRPTNDPEKVPATLRRRLFRRER